MNSRAFLFIHCLLAAGAPAVLPANTFTWTGSGGANWSVADNWDPSPLAGGPTTAIVFGNEVQLSTTLNISGGIQLNRLTFTETSGVRSISGTQPLVFLGDSPTLTMLNDIGASSTSIGVPIQIPNGLTIVGGTNFSRQLVLNTGSSISGAGGITLKSGLFATNSSNNTFTGPVVVQSGLYGANTSAGFGNASLVSVETGGSIQLFGNNLSFSINRPLVLAGAGGPLQGSYALGASQGGIKTWSGPVTLAGDATLRAFLESTLQISGPIAMEGHTLTATTAAGANNRVFLSGVFSGSGHLVAATDPASLGLVLSGAQANTFSGDIRVTSGRLAFTSDSKFGDPTNIITIDGGALAAFSNTSTTVVLPASREIVIGPKGATFEGQRSSFSQLRVDTILSGENPIQVRDLVEFGGANTFTGPLTVLAGGGLTITSAENLGASGSVLRLSGGSLTSENSSLSITSPTTLGSDRSIELPDVRGTILTTSQLTLGADISGPGQLVLFTSGGSSLITVASTPTHTGGTSLDGDGTVLIDAPERLGPTGSAIALQSGRLRATADLHFESDSQWSVGFSISGPRLDTNGFTVVIDGSIGIQNPADPGRLIKEGAGTLLLNGVNTYPNLTEVVQGTLGGHGSLAFDLAIRSGGVLAPGTPTETGRFSIGRDLTLEGSLFFKLGGTERGVTYDTLEIGRGFSGAFRDLNISFLNGFEKTILSSDTFVLATYDSFGSGGFGNVSGGRVETLDGLGSFAVTIGSNSLMLTDFIAIPEPAMTITLFGLMGLSFAFWRRKNQKVVVER